MLLQNRLHQVFGRAEPLLAVSRTNHRRRTMHYVCMQSTHKYFIKGVGALDCSRYSTRSAHGLNHRISQIFGAWCIMNEKYLKTFIIKPLDNFSIECVLNTFGSHSGRNKGLKACWPQRVAEGQTCIISSDWPPLTDSVHAKVMREDGRRVKYYLIDWRGGS